MSIRTDRVRGFIRREIAEMLLKQEIHDPRLSGFVSITDVRMSPDLQHATVYFSVLGGEELQSSEEGHSDRVKACQEVLTHAAGFIRSQLGRRIQMRHTPHLRFLPDNSLDYGRKIENLLNSVDIPPAESDADGEHDAVPTPSAKEL